MKANKQRSMCSSSDSVINPEFLDDESYKQIIKEMKLAISVIRDEVGVGIQGYEKLNQLLNDRKPLPSK